MSLRVCSLGSGSRGNALLIESDATLLLVDCGLPLKTLKQRLHEAGRSVEDISALLVTHEHADHSRGIGPLVGRHEVPVFTTRGTASAIEPIDCFEALGFRLTLEIGSIEVTAFPVPHDAREPCQFVFSDGRHRVGLLTDTGHATNHILERLDGCDALAIEFNHDVDSLMAGPYPESVKTRVASDYGHLSNEQAANLVSMIDHKRLRWLLGLHLSEQNNSPDRVRASLDGLRESSHFELVLATQGTPCDWLELG